MTDSAQAQQPTCGDGYPLPYTTAQGFAGERRCELQPGHDGYHLWQQCQWPPAQQQTGADELAAEPRHFDGYRGLSSRTRHYWPDAVVLGVGEGRFSPGPLFDMGWNARQPEVDQLSAQVATAEAERGEERRNASRLFDELRAENEAMRDVLKRLVQLGRWDADEPDNAWRVAWETAEEVLARLDEQPSAPQQTPQQGQQPASDKLDALADSQPDGAAADPHSAS